MPLPVEVIEAEMLNLSPAERGVLLNRLIESLERDTAWEQAWAAECDRRQARTDQAGTWLPVEQVLSELKAKLA